MLAIRLTRNAGDLAQFFVKIDAVCSRQIWFEHKADGSVARTHVHGLVEGLTVSKETLRNWLRFGDAVHIDQIRTNWNKADWSFKEHYKSPFGKKPIDINMVTYMSKGKLEPVHKKDFDDWRIYRDAWVEPVRRQAKLTDREVPTTDKQITQWEMLDQVRRMLDHVDDPTDDQIIEKIIFVHNTHHKLLSRYKVRDFYDSYKAYYGSSKQSFTEMIKTLCYKT